MEYNITNYQNGFSQVASGQWTEEVITICIPSGPTELLTFVSETISNVIRQHRSSVLAECDYMMMPDYPISDENRSALLTYRQALRDLPEQAGFPFDVVWPTKPF